MIKSNSDHVLRVDNAAVKLATMAMANSSGNLILSACKRNSLCTCVENENHNSISQIQTTNQQSLCEPEFRKQNCTEHLKTEANKKCKLVLNETSISDDQNQSNSQNIQNQSNQSGQNQNNDEQALRNQNNELNNQQQNNDQDNNQNNQINLNQFQIANQMVDINNNIIDQELMLVDENNNLVGLPDANFDLNNNYLWNNNQNNLEQQHQQNDLNDQPQNQNQQPNNERTNQQTQMNNLSKDKLNLNLALNCTSSNAFQSVQIKQRKKLLELNLNQDLSKPRTSKQFCSPMNEEENVIKEEQEEKCDLTSNHYCTFKRSSSSSGRRKKSLQGKKCLTKHLNKCEHYHSMDCTTPEAIFNDSKKNFKKATTPITLCPTTPTIKEEKILITSDCRTETSDSKKSTNKSNLETKTLLIAQCPICPICLFTLNEPCKPNNCSHSFCELCVIEWAKLSNECPLCRKPFDSLLNKHGNALECSINSQMDNLEQTSLEDILNFDDLNWPFIASSFLNQNSQGNPADQQCEQINSILNLVFGHIGLETNMPQNMSDIQWPF